MKLALSMGCWAALVLAVGCASSTIERRISERSTAYAGLAPEQRAAVDQGEIRAQMDTNAVYIAWGKPSRVHTTTTPAGEELRWEYWRRWTRVHPHWSIEPTAGGFYVTAEYRPTTSSWNYLSDWVVFRDDRVIRWGRFPRPAY
jgi:hypothetical protein